MGQIYIKVLLIMAVLFAFMIPGFALKKLKMLGESATLSLSNILLYVCQPALAIKAFCVFSEGDWEVVNSVRKTTLLGNFGITLVISVLCIFAVLGLCKLIFIKAGNKKTANVYSFAAIFSNCGFLGIPFIEMFTDGDPLAVIYMMVFNVAFNVLCWTVGVVLITGSFKEIRIKKLICNPVLIANLVGLIIFFVPQINFFMFDGLETLRIFPQYLGYMTAPLSMFIVGIRIAEMTPKQLFCNKGVYISGALRLIIAPFLTLAIALPFYLLLSHARGGISGTEDYVFLAPVIAMAMSPAAVVVAMAERFDGDRQTAASVFVANTIISIITIPLILMAVIAAWGAFTGQVL